MTRASLPTNLNPGIVHLEDWVAIADGNLRTARALLNWGCRTQPSTTTNRASLKWSRRGLTTPFRFTTRRYTAA